MRSPSPRARGECRGEGAWPPGSESRQRPLTRLLRSRPLPAQRGEVQKENPFSRRMLCVRVLLTVTATKDSLPNRRGKRSAERRIVQPMSASSAAARRPLFREGGHARLSALTLAAFAISFNPDGSAPEPGFPQASADRCFACFAEKACPRLSTLRADRSFCRSTGDPEPPECGSAKSARGDRSSLRCFGMPSGTAP
jgi:hypothetical protein